MKCVLLSIRPNWCKLILSGMKTVEVRRTCPVHGTPFKVYIYCTLTASKAFVSDDCNWDVSAGSSRWPDKRGRVIGEFICKKMTVLTHVGAMGSAEPARLNILAPGMYYKPADDLLKAACMNEVEAEKYLKGGDGIGWHISNLKIYDRLLDLQDFTGPQKTRFGMRPVKINRPPQSWRYVEELECT